MPIQLDEYDVSILKALLKDGRKSFRQFSRETNISTPTVKARFERLVNVGFIKAVVPIVDFEKVQHDNNISDLQTEVYQDQQDPKKIRSNIKKSLEIIVNCDFCHGSIAGEREAK